VRWAVLSCLLLAMILVPFFLFEDQFNVLAERLARGEGSTWYSAVGIAALLTSDVVLPIPSSLVSAAAGALLGFWRGTAVIWIGMTGACVTGYAIGAYATGFARRFIGEASLRRAESLAAQYGDTALIVCRPVPVLAEASVIFAGVVRTPLARFLVLTSWSNLGVALSYAAIGAFSVRATSFLLAFAGAITLPAIAWVIARLVFGRRVRA
jgi:uncharacterized membrane protein YdjX (TVP38/TMEM64 family)